MYEHKLVQLTSASNRAEFELNRLEHEGWDIRAVFHTGTGYSAWCRREPLEVDVVEIKPRKNTTKV
jgi:hypothetical protein